MTLALAHSKAAPAFNVAFYSVAATVIPVLFLAIAVQGRLFHDLLDASTEAISRFAQRYRQPPGAPGRVRAAMGAYFASLLLSGVAIVIVFYGVFGESIAVISLYSRRPFGAPSSVLEGVIILTATTAAGPALALLRAIRAMFRGLDLAGKTSPEKPDPAYEAGSIPGAGASDGTVEADTA
jgi:hypothetical protein